MKKDRFFTGRNSTERHCRIRFARRASCTGAVLCIAMASFALSGCTSSKGAEPDVPTVTVQVDAAEVTKIERKVIAEAVLFPRDQAAIVPKISAPVKKFYVDRGSTVHAGQLLAELENQDLVGAVTENRGGYEQAEA